MNKVLIIGNSGSGKSWLSLRLANIFNIKEVNLDSIFWEPGGFNLKRSPEVIDQELLTLAKEDSWVAEGVFGTLAEKLISSADTLLFLDLDWKLCRSSLLSRGSESSKQLDKEVAEDNFQNLLTWASEYKFRNSKSSYKFHNELFDQFKGKKIRFKSREQINTFVNKHKMLTS